MSTPEDNIEVAVKHLESVATEIESLRDALAKHTGAAAGLEDMSSVLGKLAHNLASLPSAIQGQFADVPVMIEQIKASLEPAGSLEAAIHQTASNQTAVLEKNLTAQQSLHEESVSELYTARTEIHALRVEVSELKSLVTILAQAQQRAFQAVLDNIDQRASSIEFSDFRKLQQDTSTSVHNRLEMIEQNTSTLVATSQKGLFARLFGTK